MNKKQRKEIRETILKHRRPVMVTFYDVLIKDLDRDELEAMVHMLMEEKERLREQYRDALKIF